MVAPVAGIAVRVGASFVQTPTGRAVIGAAVASVVAVPVILAVTAAAMVGSLTQAVTGGGGAVITATACAPTSGPGAVATLDAEQTPNASAILAVVKGAAALGDEAARQRAGVIAIAVALQESSLRNLPGGDRDSVGLFQQRPSQGWGAPEQLQDPVYATSAFLGVNPSVTNGGLIGVQGWQAGELATVAQAVQRSADGSLYAGREATARAVVETLWTSTVAIATGAPATAAADVSVTVTPAAAVTPCPAGNGDDGTYDGPGAWGGWANGQIPLDQLMALPWATGQQLRPDAAAALIELNELYKASFGVDIAITDSYRDLAGQQAVYAQKPGLAARPGTSNHGWGLAVDLGGGINGWGTPERDWFIEWAPRAGWVSPAWAQPGAGREEPWHWEYIGTGTAS